MRLNKLYKLRETAAEISQQAHEGQKYGEHDYFTHHILGVISILQKFSNDLNEHEKVTLEIIGLLHDVVEDTHVTLEDIKDIFGVTIRDSVDALTKRKGEHLDDYLVRVKRDYYAPKVKRADSFFNLGSSIASRSARLRDKYLYVLGQIG